MLSYANLEMETAKYPTSPTLLLYMAGRRISKFVPADSFQVMPLKTAHKFSPIKEDLECFHNIIQTCNDNQSLSMNMD